jgi:hypothetical protein
MGDLTQKRADEIFRDINMQREWFLHHELPGVLVT